MLTEWRSSPFFFLLSPFLSSRAFYLLAFYLLPLTALSITIGPHISILVADTSGPVASARLRSTPRRLIYSRPAKRTVTYVGYIMITSCITPKLVDIINNIVVVHPGIPANLSSLLTITRALLGFSRGSYLSIIGRGLPAVSTQELLAKKIGCR